MLGTLVRSSLFGLGIMAIVSSPAAAFPKRTLELVPRITSRTCANKAMVNTKKDRVSMVA